MKRAIFLVCILFAFEIGMSQSVDSMVDVGTHKLHFTILKGHGTPILFEAGNGDDGTVWQPIVNEILKKTGATIIMYDRAGLGQSEIDTNSISFENEVKSLEVGLKKLGYSKKIFLVCHSFGGYYASLFTYRNIKKVKGVVCVDIATPCFFTKEWSDQFISSIGPSDWDMIKQYKPGLYYVLKNFSTTAVFMQDKFPDARTAVTMIRAENIQKMIKEEEREKWENCCRSFGTIPNHQYIIAKNADHKVWDKNPAVVVEEIVKLYQKVN